MYMTLYVSYLFHIQTGLGWFFVPYNLVNVKNSENNVIDENVTLIINFISN